MVQRRRSRHTQPRVRRPGGLLVRGALVLLSGSALLPSAAIAAPQGGPGIYTCIDDKGRRLTADRPIPECIAKEQRLLNRDGSLKNVRPPTLTADERSEVEARERKAAEERAARADAVRRDRNLLARYPDEAAHVKAREAALDPLRQAMRNSEARLLSLAEERRPLMNEAEFYVGRQMPTKLKAQIEGNDTAQLAQRTAMQTQEAEFERVVKLYDAELEHLKKLWAGAPPGSLGPVAVAPNIEPVRATPR